MEGRPDRINTPENAYFSIPFFLFYLIKYPQTFVNLKFSSWHILSWRKTYSENLQLLHCAFLSSFCWIFSIVYSSSLLPGNFELFLSLEIHKYLWKIQNFKFPFSGDYFMINEIFDLNYWFIQFPAGILKREKTVDSA